MNTPLSSQSSWLVNQELLHHSQQQSEILSFFNLVAWHIRIKGDKWSSTVCHTAATEKKFENMSFTKSSPSSDRSSFEGLTQS